jgi:hypothetical protein
MVKKLVVGLFCITSLFAQNNLKYQDESKFNNIDPRIFVGLEGAYNYTSSNEELDKLIYSYGLYIGVPVYKYELILKGKNLIASGFDISAQSIAFNIPFDGTSTKETYWGVTAGNAKIEFDNHTSKNLLKATNDGNFYGIHIGARNKYTRNIFVRYELEYLKYDLESKKTDNKTLDIESSIEFLVGVEYRF